MKNYFLILQGHSDFAIAKEEIKRMGVKPVPADNLNIAYQHVLFHFDGIPEIKAYLSGQDYENVLAIEISSKLSGKFTKGERRFYDTGKIKRTFILGLEENDIFIVEEADFIQLKEECTCPKTCDCQNPPPDNWDGEGDGVYHTSLHCPVHYLNPKPDDDCPVHTKWDGKEPVAIWEPKGSQGGN